MLLLLLLLFWPNRGLEPAPEPRVAYQEVELRRSTAPRAPRLKKTRTARASGRATPRKGPARQAGDLRFARLPLPPADGGTVNEPGANGVSRFIPANEYRFIYQIIDQNLTYPFELRQRDIQGRVVLRLSFTKEGVLLRDRTEVVSASSNYLRVHVQRMLRKLFLDPLPKPQRTFTGPFTLVCSFHFERTEHNEADLIAARRFIQKNNLYFYRQEHHSKLQWQLGPVSGLGIVPALGVDLGGAFDQVGRLFSSRTKKDPLARYRDDPEW